MSNKPNQPNDQRRRDEETRLSMRHLAGSASAATAPKDEDDDDEDWGDVSPKKTTTATAAPSTPVKKDEDEDLDREELDDEDLERELAGDQDDEEEDEDVPVSKTPITTEVKNQPVFTDMNQPVFTHLPVDPETPNVDDDAMMRQIDQLQTNLPAMERVLNSKLEQINSQRKKLDEEEKGIRSRINFLRVLSGKQPLDQEEDDDENPAAGAPRRRRRRNSTTATPEGATPAAAAQSSDEDEDGVPATGGRGGRGKKRFHNDKSWKDVICEALLTMKHEACSDPKLNEKPFTGFVNDITNKVIAPVEKGGLGYKTTSGKPTNTVRIQIYRLQNEGKLISNGDGSYTLKKATIREMGHDPVALAGGSAPAAE